MPIFLFFRFQELQLFTYINKKWLALWISKEIWILSELHQFVYAAIDNWPTFKRLNAIFFFFVARSTFFWSANAISHTREAKYRPAGMFAPHISITNEPNLVCPSKNKISNEMKWDSKLKQPHDQMNEGKKHETPFSNVWRRNFCNFFRCVHSCFYTVLLRQIATISLCLF